MLINPLPSPIDEVYSALKSEITWLHGRWICYRQLFAESERRIELLNECAAAFFFIIQDVLLDEVQVSLSKLTAPAKSGKNENLSLEQLQKRLEIHGDSSLAASNREVLNKLQGQCAPFREWRNKQLAHLDLLTSMKATPNPLPGISQQMIDDSLGTVRDYMNAIEHHYADSEFGYEHFIMSSDGTALVGLLKSGLRYEELRQEEKVKYDDWQLGKWHDA
jgi:hypothetical protein